MSDIISYGELKQVARKIRKSGKTIVFTTGAFDTLHTGHLDHLARCKALVPNSCLIVAVCGDKALKRTKGLKRPYFSEEIRAITLAEEGTADFVVINHDKSSKKGLSHSRIAKLLRPDIWAMPKDSWYFEFKKALCKKLGIKLKITPRIPPQGIAEISTSIILDQIETQKLSSVFRRQRKKQSKQTSRDSREIIGLLPLC